MREKRRQDEDPKVTLYDTATPETDAAGVRIEGRGKQRGFLPGNTRTGRASGNGKGRECV